MRLINTFLFLFGFIALFSCNREKFVDDKIIENELQNLKTMEVSYKDQTLKVLSRVESGGGLRSVSFDGISEESCAKYALDMQEKVDFDPEKNLKPYLLSKGLSDETVNILTSLKDYMNNRKFLSAYEISKLNIPFSDKKILVQVFSSLSVAIGYKFDGLRLTKGDKISMAMDACWEDYLTDLGFYTTTGAVAGSLGGPLGFAVGGIIGVATARYELYKCMKNARRL